ncbi:MAG: hypothetical protein AAFV19_06940 [Pseudomonadota bacterium]
MSQLNEAIARLAKSVDHLERAVAGIEQNEDQRSDGVAEVPAILAERDELADEVRVLRERAEQDAILRAEAAEAVRQALTDLRGAVGGEVAANA